MHNVKVGVEEPLHPLYPENVPETDFSHLTLFFWDFLEASGPCNLFLCDKALGSVSVLGRGAVSARGVSLLDIL